MNKISAGMSRKAFLGALGKLMLLLEGAMSIPLFRGKARAFGAQKKTQEPGQRKFGFAVDIDKCIGCARCVEACKSENGVSKEPFYFRTWVERYSVRRGGKVDVDSPNGGLDGYPAQKNPKEVERTFFVPKLCNHCQDSPCVQVCPVGATFETKDGVVLIDEDYCIGCRYCIQACPYGTRFFNPEKGTADKCTMCYHRITKGLKPACVEVCPTHARVWGDLNNPKSEVSTFVRNHKVQHLKPHLGTNPKVFYNGLDEVVS